MKPGQFLRFIVEPEKLEKINKVVIYNQGEVVDQEYIDGGVYLKVQKLPDPETPDS